MSKIYNMKTITKNAISAAISKFKKSFRDKEVEEAFKAGVEWREQKDAAIIRELHEDYARLYQSYEKVKTGIRKQDCCTGCKYYQK